MKLNELVFFTKQIDDFLGCETLEEVRQKLINFKTDLRTLYEVDHVPLNYDGLNFKMQPKNKIGFAGRVHSDETKKRMADSHKGRPSGVAGKHYHLSDETRRKMSIAKQKKSK